MGLPGTIDAPVYNGLRDVLNRHPTITTVGFEPDSISKEFVRANVAPARIEPPTGPDSPVIDVEWRFRGDTAFYRIHYADPNTGFNCGWHRDSDHPDLGPVHFQYEHPKNRGRGLQTFEIHEIGCDGDTVVCTSAAVRNENSRIHLLRIAASEHKADGRFEMFLQRGDNEIVTRRPGG